MKSEKISDLHNLIRQIHPDMSKAEKRIADFLLENDINILDYSAEELSKASGTSAASIVRFCRKLGFKGYMEMKFQIERALVSFVGEDQQIELTDDVPSVQNKVLSYYSSLIDDMHHALAPDDIECAAAIIADAERVLFFSEGASGAMASYGVSIFSYAGVYCHAQTDPAFQIMSASHLGEKDAVVAISHSGQSVNLLDTLREVKENGVPVVCITGYKDSALKKYSDVTLAANLKRPMYFSELPAGRLEEFCILSILQSAVLIRNFNRASKVTKQIRRALAQKRVGKKSKRDF